MRTFGTGAFKESYIHVNGRNCVEKYEVEVASCSFGGRAKYEGIRILGGWVTVL